MLSSYLAFPLFLSQTIPPFSLHWRKNMEDRCPTVCVSLRNSQGDSDRNCVWSGPLLASHMDPWLPGGTVPLGPKKPLWLESRAQQASPFSTRSSQGLPCTINHPAQLSLTRGDCQEARVPFLSSDTSAFSLRSIFMKKKKKEKQTKNNKKTTVYFQNQSLPSKTKNLSIQKENALVLIQKHPVTPIT